MFHLLFANHSDNSYQIYTQFVFMIITKWSRDKSTTEMWFVITPLQIWQIPLICSTNQISISAVLIGHRMIGSCLPTFFPPRATNIFSHIKCIHITIDNIIYNNLCWYMFTGVCPFLLHIKWSRENSIVSIRVTKCNLTWNLIVSRCHLMHIMITDPSLMHTCMRDE